TLEAGRGRERGRQERRNRDARRRLPQPPQGRATPRRRRRQDRGLEPAEQDRPDAPGDRRGPPPGPQLQAVPADGGRLPSRDARRRGDTPEESPAPGQPPQVRVRGKAEKTPAIGSLSIDREGARETGRTVSFKSTWGGDRHRDMRQLYPDVSWF